MKIKQIIIPDCECMSDDEWDKMIEILDELPINYQVWESDEGSTKGWNDKMSKLWKRNEKWKNNRLDNNTTTVFFRVYYYYNDIIQIIDKL